jgi:HemK-related putative methylase
MKKEVYKPREDTYLILEQVRRYAEGIVLDMGTGSGILAIEASRKADFVYGADINKKAVDQAEKSAQGIENIKFIKSDLFNYFKKNPEMFDLIIFNPPYLPEEKYEPRELKLAISGGKKGYELLERFLADASQFLKPAGKILIVFSTLTKQNKVHEIIDNYGFNYHKLAEQSFFFETLFVYLLQKSDFLISVEEEGIKNIKKLAKGHRGLIYTGIKNKKKIAVKRKNPKSKAVARIENEARWLRFLNRYKIGPKFIMRKDDYFIYYFAPGIFFPEFIEKANKTNIRKIIKSVFEQCHQLDKLKINKEEMHHPYKHIIVDKNKAVLIDFERTHKTDKPHNVTQFCQYIISGNIFNTLKKKGFKIDKKTIMSLAAKYKKNTEKSNLSSILSSIK